MHIKLYLATSLLIGLMMAIFLKSYAFSCLSLIVVIVGTLVVASGFIEFKIKERDCHYRCFLTKESKLYKLLSSVIFTTIIYIIYSIALVVTIFVDIIFFSNIMWLYLALHVGIILAIYTFIKKQLKDTIKPKMLQLITREFTIKIGSVVLFLVFMISLYLSDTPSYLAPTIQETTQNATNLVGSSCQVIDYVVRVKAELNAIIYWLTSITSQHSDDENSRVLIWLGYILFNTLSAIGINRLLVGILYIVDRIFHPEHSSN